MNEKLVLAYSGGLDTSAAIKWIKEKYGTDVITVTIDVGNEKDFTLVKEKAINAGALKAIVIDAKDSYVNEFIFPALKANAFYEGEYPLATALSRPLMARLMVEVARQEGATAIAHGCTGKGNDQVRFEVSIAALAPEMKTVAPAREWGMTREETIAYAKKHGIPVPVTVKSPYSVDAAVWGRSIECGILENPWNEPPEDAYEMTVSVEQAPEKPEYIEIDFEEGIPVALNGTAMGGLALIQKLNEIAGGHGVGRIDMVENRLVGIKSREIYEAPAAVTLLKAHHGLEALVLSKPQMNFKSRVSQEYADLIYNGLWFSSHREDLAAYVDSTQRYVTGTVRVKLHKGNATVVGRKSPFSLYQLSLATYDKGDLFDQNAAPGFIHIWGLPLKTQANSQKKGNC
ncbi:MAG: argininosuccinate synthase [Dehalococcoidales bacterium]|mgnify:CR=1 FL=1|jgi:argininosuccinate synthase|nr:argininosuccinate synthase [Dehalococcoidales bacterium]MDD3264609.1 argininosuccinate synthase [Dehalococcoidales bacterium]MDD4322094.1 argininosuccinate synthase [Dehalococcoidales bacterium]MDD4793665.1 argininosuccinate synthase [Dehalococcoidales bacterium]MDD5122409.1 argininosuccinate synthase [Dehalococcoidales bacterium]